ncbi:NUDIX domain-containing protein [Kribbella solani]|uniref:NUDIX domain-containing protein n=1 Tax=Kribbella solani TaxID=236067 RepID=UPI0029ADEACD|nr:NUDIX domain-containing protein [Kribbella solani]MDX2972180.1 NUDIX domain-containing protein [Kribbella solani]
MNTYVGIAARARQIVNSGEYSTATWFSSAVANVAVHAHPAIVPLLTSHIYYSTSSAPAGGGETWTVSGSENPDAWWSLGLSNIRGWEPLLDYGANGLVVDLDDSLRVVVNPSTRSVIVRDRAERKVYLVGHDVRGLFLDLYRSVRGIHSGLAITNGWIPFHASAVKRNDKIICFVGDKGSGKSTALLNLATANLDDLALVSNDKSYLHIGADMRLLAWPSVINAGADSLVSVGAERLLSPGFHHGNGGMAFLMQDLPLIEQFPAIIGGVAQPAKIRLLPDELRRSLASTFAAEGRVAAIIQSQLRLTEKESTFEVVTGAAARSQIVRENILSDWTNHPDWLGIADAPGVAAGAQIAVSPEILVGRLTVGRDGKEVTRGIVGALTGPDVLAGLHLADAVGDAKSYLPKYHFGVYARIRQGSKVLLVRKTRGPYRGLYDLPGGRPEFGESWPDALRRELIEELGLQFAVADRFRRFQLGVTESSDGTRINLMHHGAFADLELTDGAEVPRTASPDTDGAEWVDVESQYGSLSALAREVLSL